MSHIDVINVELLLSSALTGSFFFGQMSSSNGNSSCSNSSSRSSYNTTTTSLVSPIVTKCSTAFELYFDNPANDESNGGQLRASQASSSPSTTITKPKSLQEAFQNYRNYKLVILNLLKIFLIDL
jgi:hypothetical protein